MPRPRGCVSVPRRRRPRPGRRPARAEIVVRLEVTADRAPVHLEPDRPQSRRRDPEPRRRRSSSRARRSSGRAGSTSSSRPPRSGRTLAGYVHDGVVRKLNSTLKVIDLTPAEPEIVESRASSTCPKAACPTSAWGQSEDGILRGRGPSPQPRAVRGHGVPALPPRRPRQALPGHLRPGRPAARLGPAPPPRALRGQGPLRRRLQQDPGVPERQGRRAPLQQRGLEGPGLRRAGREAGHGRHLGQPEPVLGVGLPGAPALRLSLSGENSEVLFAAEISDLKAKNPASF
ncbi:MAG: hypothetical protein M0C28_45420 [Candidatus Moduliflexus flocculans]|nr:hypothetical protein [Candidatus Moduliflexus flocculans]